MAGNYFSFSKMTFPCVKKRVGSKNNVIENLEKEFTVYKWSDIVPQPGGSIGSGSFGSVFVAKSAKRPVVDSNECRASFVVKKILNEEALEQKIFLKEARIMKCITSEYVVKLIGICLVPSALILEYVYFDFKPFGTEVKVSSLDQFLKYNDCEDQVGKFPVHVKISLDISRGLLYLHERGIVHRDIKPANVLVSNQHFSNLKEEEVCYCFW